LVDISNTFLSRTQILMLLFIICSGASSTGSVEGEGRWRHRRRHCQQGDRQPRAAHQTSIAEQMGVVVLQERQEQRLGQQP